MMHEDVWKVLFKASEVPPPTTEDRGLNAKRHDNSVSTLHLTRCAFPRYIHGRNLSHCTDLTGIRGDGGDCPTPLPEDLATALLTEMLVPAPYEVPEKKAKKKATGTR